MDILGAKNNFKIENFKKFVYIETTRNYFILQFAR